MINNKCYENVLSFVFFLNSIGEIKRNNGKLVVDYLVFRYAKRIYPITNRLVVEIVSKKDKVIIDFNLFSDKLLNIYAPPCLWFYCSATKLSLNFILMGACCSLALFVL